MKKEDEINELMFKNDKESLAEKLFDAQAKLSEHERLHGELNNVLNPVDAPTIPSLCDLVASVQSDLSDARVMVDKFSKQNSILALGNESLKAELSALKEGVVEEYEVFRRPECGEMDIPNGCHCGDYVPFKVKVTITEVKE
jgi:hypothetical protein